MNYSRRNFIKQNSMVTLGAALTGSASSLLLSSFAFDLVYNGPLRSKIKVTTTNWNSGRGFYELEQ